MSLLMMVLFYFLLMGFTTVLESKVMGLVQSSVSVFSSLFLGFYQFYLDFFKLLIKGFFDKVFVKMFYYNCFLFLFILNNVFIFVWVLFLCCSGVLVLGDLFLVLLLEGNNLVFKIYLFYFISYKFVFYNESSLKSVFVFLEVVYIYFLFLLMFLKSLECGIFGSSYLSGYSFNFFVIMFFFLFMVLMVKSFSTPFDYLEVENELVNGISLEFYGQSFLLWSLVEYSSIFNNVFFISFLFVNFFSINILLLSFFIVLFLFMLLFFSSVFVSFKVESSIYLLLFLYCISNIILFIFVLV